MEFWLWSHWSHITNMMWCPLDIRGKEMTNTWPYKAWFAKSTWIQVDHFSCNISTQWRCLDQAMRCAFDDMHTDILEHDKAKRFWHHNSSIKHYINTVILIRDWSLPVGSWNFWLKLNFMQHYSWNGTKKIQWNFSNLKQQKFGPFHEDHEVQISIN